LVSKKTFKAYFVLPVCLLLLSALQEVAIYRLRFEFEDPRLFTLAIIALSAIGFSLVGDFIAPKIGFLLEKGHGFSKGTAGALGVWLFIMAGSAGIFYLYYNIWGIETPEMLLPEKLKPGVAQKY